MGGSDGRWCVRHVPAAVMLVVHSVISQWPHGGFGGGVVAMKTLPDVREVRVRVGAPASSKCRKGVRDKTKVAKLGSFTL